MPDEEIEVPSSLGEDVALRLSDFPPVSWDTAVQEICRARMNPEQGQAEGETSP
jgi:hypothetical protein